MRRFLFSSLLVVFSFTALAQQAGMGIVVGIPMREFREATRAEGYGLNFTVLFPLGTEVVTLGANLDYMIYGLNAKDENLYADITVGNTVIDRLYIPLRVITTNSIFGMHAMMRVTAPTDGVRPYFEGLFGFRYISTSTRIEDRSEDRFWTQDQDDNIIVRRTNLGDFVLSYGGGGGLQFELGKNAYLDLRGYYLLGGRADFYDGDDTKRWKVEFTSDPSSYDPDNLDSDDFTIGSSPKNSTTDMLVVQLGATFKF